MLQRIQPTKQQKAAWDRLLMQQSYADAFLYSDWLNSVFPSWELLMKDDFSGGIPFFHSSILGYSRLLLPNFIQALDWIGVPPNEPEKEQLCGILEQYDWLSMPYIFNLKLSDVTPQLKRHQILTLTPEQRFPTKVWGRNIRKAENGPAIQIAPMPLEHFITEWKREMKSKGQPYSTKDYTVLKRAATKALQRQSAEILGVINEKGEWWCGQLFLYSPSSMYLVNCFTTAEGREYSSLHYLLYETIKRKAKDTDNYRVHFGGSNIPVIADFNKNFGAVDESYQYFNRNRMPWWIKLWRA